MIRPIYLAAPLSAPTPEARAARLARAQALRDQIECDLSVQVFLPHERIARHYGYPEQDESPQDRLDAMAQCLAAVRAVHAAGGAFHVLTLPDGTLSRGCQAELDHWIEVGGGEPVVWRST